MEHVNPTPARFTGLILRGVVAPAVLSFATAVPIQAAVFRCAAGDVACLVDAINQSNANGQRNTIRLEAGTYTLTNPDNNTDGANGLPSITGHVVIRGKGADATSIARASSATAMRLLHVGSSGQLTVDGVTLTGGGGILFSGEGAGVYNGGGAVDIIRSVVRANGAFATSGGGLANIRGVMNIRWSTVTGNSSGLAGALITRGGTVRILHSHFSRNRTQPNGGTVLAIDGATLLVSRSSFDRNGFIAITVHSGTRLVVTDSSVTENTGEFAAGMAIGSSAVALVVNTTFSGHQLRPFPQSQGSAINNSGTLLLVNSTLADNGPRFVPSPPPPAALASGAGATTVLVNTIVARNTDAPGVSRDCFGPITSLGHNLIGNTTGCAVALQGSDRTGDPGLGALSDDGSPGNGHIPLVAGSQAVDAGNDLVCPRRDQIGNRRIRPCDIGAIEFQRADRGRPRVTANGSALGRADLSKLLADLEHVASELQWVTADDEDGLKEIKSLVDQVTRLARDRRSSDGGDKGK